MSSSADAHLMTQPTGMCETTAPAITVEYVLDGPRTAAAVCRGDSRLVGAVIHDGVEPQYITGHNICNALQRRNSCRRVYYDAVLAQCIEQSSGIPAADEFDDVRLMLRLLDENLDIDSALQRITGASSDSPATMSSGWPDLAAAAQEEQIRCEERRATTTQFLSQHLPPDLIAEKTESVYHAVELPTTTITSAMIRHGIGVNFARLQEQLDQYQAQEEAATAQLQQIAGRQLNPNSYPEMCEYLYGELGLPVLAWTDGSNPALDQAVLQQLARLHPAPEAFRRHGEMKVIASALRAVDALASRRTGRVHPHLDQLGTVTGRYSCCEPNLQALPEPVLSVFEAREGCAFIEADFSQTELRILAHVTQDPGLLDAFRTGIDIHRRTAARVLGISESDVSVEQRGRIGKSINFGTIYGQTGYGLASKLGTTVQEADAFLTAYFRAHPGVRSWIDQTQQSVAAHGYVTTIFGRRRRFPQLTEMDPAERHQAERRAVNAVIQGTAADLMKMAMCCLEAELPADCRLLLTVHDSVLLEVPIDRAVELQLTVHRVLEQLPAGFLVPLTVKSGVGRTWAECREAVHQP